MRTCGILALIVLTAAGQQPPKANIKFSTTSNLVVVDVTVKDKAGNVIDNLGKGDFTVLEDGKPQKIVVFEQQKLATEPEPPPPAPELGSVHELPENPKTSISAETPGTVQYHDKRLLVLYFDFS